MEDDVLINGRTTIGFVYGFGDGCHRDDVLINGRTTIGFVYAFGDGCHRDHVLINGRSCIDIVVDVVGSGSSRRGLVYALGVSDT